MEMNKLLLVAAGALALGLTSQASAADLPARTYTKAPPLVAPVYNWSGFYVGINGGGGSSHNCWDLVTPPAVLGIIPEGCHDLDRRHRRWSDRLSLAGHQLGVRPRSA